MGTVIELAARRRSMGGTLAFLSSRHTLPVDVNVRDASSLAYWCRHFDTTAERLLDAVKRVGTNPSIVRLALRTR